MQSEHAGYVPARIAVLPCQSWPNGARYRSEPLSNVSAADLDSFCREFDKRVLDAFTNQPYMNGFTPKYLAKLLSENNQPTLLQDAYKSWQHEANACEKCENAPDYYVNTIAPRQSWQTWLQTFSTAAKHADAVLIPFVTFAYTKSYNDRGLVVAERAAGVVVLLVDTNQGGLLWAGGREASIPNKKLESAAVPQDVAVPGWNELDDRLFTEDLWKEFPGRQVY